MADHTHIEWTEATWNVATGCTRVSPGCDHCYIERTPPFRMAHRVFDGDGVGSTTGVNLYPDRLQMPLRWRKPRRIFVCSLADLFHDQVPDEYIAKVFAVMAFAHWHTFQVLTKRPARMRALLSSDRFLDLFDREYCRIPDWNDRWPDLEFAAGTTHLADGPLSNVQGGVSTENQQWAGNRISILLRTPLAVRFISAEPLLGPIDLGFEECDHHGRLHGDVGCWRALDWVITGGESGPGARPAHPDWFRSIRDQCQTAGVAYLHKQNGEYLPWSGIYDGGHPGVYVNRETGAVISWEEGQWQHRRLVRDNMNWQPMRRVGKKTAGRLLDGRTWDEYPVTK